MHDPSSSASKTTRCWRWSKPHEACLQPLNLPPRSPWHGLCSAVSISPRNSVSTHDDRDALASARSALVLASAASGLAPPVDGVTAAVADTAALTEDIAYAARLGFGGTLCIHPAQVAAAAAALAPSAADVAWTQRVLAAEGDAVAVVEGRMVDKPVFDRARRILAAAP
jgi:citrate lyase beta subunit